MLNYVVDPNVLGPHVPKGTELDHRNGNHFVSLVGFLFLDTHILSLPAFFHQNFEEVNLRFYVRRTVPVIPALAWCSPGRWCRCHWFHRSPELPTMSRTGPFQCNTLSLRPMASSRVSSIDLADRVTNA